MRSGGILQARLQEINETRPNLRAAGRGQRDNCHTVQTLETAPNGRRLLFGQWRARILPSFAGMQILAVRVRGERFGLPTENVVEIFRAVAVSPLPGSPAVISGVINIRGEPVVVIDPAVRFGNPETPVTPDDNFVLVQTPARPVAIRVDIAEDLIEVDDGALTNASSTSATLDKLHGVAVMPDGALVIYDVAAFLTQAEDEALTDALALAAVVR